jgi:hypothetical protein
VEYLKEGVEFARSTLSFDELRRTACPDCEAFVVHSPELRRDAGELQVMVAVSAYLGAKKHVEEVTIPSQVHSTPSGDVLELKNLLVLAKRDSKWSIIGWHY